MILLDTHTLVWWTSEKGRLPKMLDGEITKAYENYEVCVSAISIWEVALLVKKETLLLKMPFQAWYNIFNQLTKLKSVPIDNKIALLSINLPGSFHKDPADRFIVATALSLGCPIATKDQKILSYKKVKSVW